MIASDFKCQRNLHMLISIEILHDFHPHDHHHCVYHDTCSVLDSGTSTWGERRPSLWSEPQNEGRAAVAQDAAEFVEDGLLRSQGRQGAARAAQPEQEHPETPSQAQQAEDAEPRA